MSDTEQITTEIYNHWEQIKRVLAIKRGENWDQELPDEMILRVEERPDDQPLVWFETNGTLVSSNRL